MSDGCGCFSKLPPAPKPQRSEFIQDVSGSLAVHVKSSLGVRVSWLVETRKKLPENAYVEAEFPDINDPNSPFKVPFSKIEDSNRLYVVSPEISTKCGLMPVKLKIYEDERRLRLVSLHESKILSRIDTSNCTVEAFKQTAYKYTS